MNNKNNRIRHSGVIDAIEGECVRVRILQTSACAACKIAGHCNASESKEKIVDVYGVTDSTRFKLGDSVIVSASVSMAMQALLYGFGLPFVVLVGVLFTVYAFTSDESLSALMGLAALIPYYILLYILRDRMRGKMLFEIERT